MRPISPATESEDGLIPRIPHPIQMLRDEADGVVLPFERYMLVSAARPVPCDSPAKAPRMAPSLCGVRSPER